MKNVAVCLRAFCWYIVRKSSLYIIQEILVPRKMDLKFKPYEAARVLSTEFLFLPLISRMSVYHTV